MPTHDPEAFARRLDPLFPAARAAVVGRCALRLLPILGDNLHVLVERVAFALINLAQFGHLMDDPPELEGELSQVKSERSGDIFTREFIGHCLRFMYEVNRTQSCGQAIQAAERAFKQQLGKTLNLEVYLRASIDHDIRLLENLAQAENWPAKSGVPMVVLGPLWPLSTERIDELISVGLSFGFNFQVDVPDESAELVLDLEVPEGVSDDQVVQLVKELALASDSLHRAYGGKGLRVLESQVLSEAPCQVGAST